MSAASREGWRQRLHDMFGLGDAVADDPHQAERRQTRLCRAEQLRAASRRRAATFGSDLFADPGFDLLLDLYIAQQQGDDGPRPGQLLAESSGVASHYVRVLERRGLLVRTPTDDPRRAWLRLTEEAAEAMDEYLDGS